jgi:Animal haem peroxidase
LNSDFKSFDDLLELFPKSYIDLLKAEYEDIEDIDLVVGGSLESYLNVEIALVGDTFDCIIRDQFKRVMGGDSYFYTNPNSPYPFTAAQIQAVKDFTFNNLICVNSGLESVPKSIFYVANDSDNPEVPCSKYKPMNLDAWKNL